LKGANSEIFNVLQIHNALKIRRFCHLDVERRASVNEDWKWHILWASFNGRVFIWVEKWRQWDAT